MGSSSRQSAGAFARRVARALVPELPPRTAPDESVVVQAAILRTAPDGCVEVLLVHRASPRAWELPGGKPDTGEPLAAAIVREVLEETSVHVEVASHVATYRRTGFRPHVSPIFRCIPIGGAPRPNDESVAVAYHPVDRLPWGTFPWLADAIRDAVEDLGGADSARPSTSRNQRLGLGAMLQAVVIHVAGIARLRA